jgi:hypothetical protein
VLYLQCAVQLCTEYSVCTCNRVLDFAPVPDLNTDVLLQKICCGAEEEGSCLLVDQGQFFTSSECCFMNNRELVN